MPQLECKDLILGYDGKPVISGLSFAVSAGDYLCIVGENGSGKSTLMKAVLGIKPPMSGTVRAGEGLTQNEIGYLPQQTVVQKDFPASVEEVVRSGCLNRRGLRPFYNSAEKQMAEDNMERLGIASLAKHCYRELSGGQQQRALLARALCAARKLLLLDEPVSGLDPKAAAEMYETISQLNSDGTTIIMISHDIVSSVKHASHILHIGSRSALFFGTKTEYADSDIGRLYAGSRGERA
ncbi:MAG: ATP-binding cassette domain-containing protein [Defluviitaleaceae bacterium]|nr:ATP-binding cassette domain-containing protein [Defluviitaleaceae bacterium]MCL2836095.1 ATP-binding cassette domain-containing protein [Defluviitaleaceae bacterium]